MNTDLESNEQAGLDSKDELIHSESPAGGQEIAPLETLSMEQTEMEPQVEASSKDGFEPLLQPEAVEPPPESDVPSSGVAEGQPPVSTKPRRMVWILAAVLGITLCLAIVVGIVAIVFFTFNKDAVASAVPSDASFYMGINLLQLTPEKTDRLLKPLLVNVEDTEFNDTESMLTDLDERMQSDFGLTFSEDIRPWVGQNIGIALSGDFSDIQLGDTKNINITLIAITRNKSASDAFLEKLRLKLEEKQGYTFNMQDYQGVTIYASSRDEFFFARSKSVVIFSNNIEGVQGAIDAQKSDSLAKDTGFKELTRKLPRERFATLFIDGEQYIKLLSQMSNSGMTAGGTLLDTTQVTQGAKDYAGSLAITEDGLRMDMIVSYDPEQMSDAYKTFMEKAGISAQTAEVLPTETMLMLTSHDLGEFMQFYEEMISGNMADDYEQSMQMLEDTLGFNLQTDLLTYLTDECGMAILPDTDGVLAQNGVPLNIILFSQQNNHEKLTDTMEKLSEKMQEMGMTINTSDEGENHYYAAGDPSLGDVVVVGLSNEYLILSFSRQGVDSVINPAQSLADKAEYKEVWSHFPDDASPVMYLELANLSSYLRDNIPYMDDAEFEKGVAILQAIPYVALSSEPLQGNIAQSTLIIFVKQPPEE